MIVLRNLQKNYYLSKTNVVHVLKGVSLAFRKNEFVSILGPSGCGKTTLLNIIGGLDVCDSGEIVVGGVSTAKFSASDWDNYRNKRIGFVFQSYNLIPHLNAVRNVEMPLVLAGMKKSECRKKAIEVLERVGLKDQIYKKPLQLSGGQMQRVALARALITDPDIILADEPTGALDAESSVQVMDLLREVSRDRLVIMVTHNNQLAEEYSTRIINLAGGVVAGDNNPFGEDEEDASSEKPTFTAADESRSEFASLYLDGVAPTHDETTREEQADSGTKRAASAKRKKEKKTAPVKKARVKKSHLSFGTAIELSARTLISKKVRTSLTSFAGSIGIIGIILVLAFSTGVNAYIKNLEEASLSMYPLSISSSSIDPMSILSSFLSGSSGSDRESYPSEEKIYTNKVLGNVMENLSNYTSNNDLPAFNDYLSETWDDSLGYYKCNYGVHFNVYAKDPGGSDKFMKTEPFTDVMDQALAGLTQLGQSLADNPMVNQAKSYAEYLSSWSELVDNDELLKTQYELVGKNSRWPSNEIKTDENGDKVAEVIISVDEKNQLNDYSLFMLGLKSEKDIVAALLQKDFFSKATFDVDDLLSLEYFVLGGYDYYAKDGDNWVKTPKSEQSGSFVTSNYSVKAKVVGIVRPRKGATGLTITGAIGYKSSLTKYLISQAVESEAVKAQQATALYKENGKIVSYSEVTDFSKATFRSAKDITSTSSTFDEKSYNERLTEMGLADESNPKSIEIYAHTFENKEKIKAYIDAYNNEQQASGNESKKIKYTDMLDSMMSFVNTMSDAISKVLIGFTSISLIVSSIMIAVIIYTSVLERRKEVGILRSIGARKLDITSIFVAESGMLGLYSGVLGVLIGWILTLPINAILQAKVGVANLAIVLWWHPLAMIAISFALSITAGVIPAFMGAKQDPAVALRTE